MSQRNREEEARIAQEAKWLLFGAGLLVLLVIVGALWTACNAA